MRNKKTVIHFFCSLLIVFAVIISVGIFVITPNNLQRAYDTVYNLFSSDSEIDISFNKINRDFFNHLEIENLEIDCRGERVLSISDVYISSGIGSILRNLFNSGSLDLNIKVDDIDFVFNQDLYDYLGSKKGNQSGLEDFINNFSVNLSVNDFSFEACFNGNIIKTTDSINIEADIGKNLTLNSVKCEIPSIFSHLAFIDSDVSFSDIVASSDSKQKIKLTVGNVNISDTFNGETLLSEFSLKNGIVDGIGSLDFADFSKDKISTKLRTIGFSYNLNLNSGKRAYDISSEMEEGSFIYGDYSVDYSNLSALCSISPGKNEKHLFLSSNKIEINGLKEYKLEEVHLSDLFLSINENETSELEVQTYIDGNCSLSEIGLFSGQVLFDSEYYSLKDFFKWDNYSNSELEIRGFKFSDYENNNLHLKFNDSDSFDVSFNLSNELLLNSSVDLNKKIAIIRSYFNRFRVNKATPLIEENISESILNLIDEETVFNGSFIYNGSIDASDKSGRVSMNIIADNMLFSDKHTTIATSVEASSSENLADIDSFAVSAFGKRFSYTGTVDLDTLFPQGILLLQQSDSGKEIFSVGFTLDDDLKGYSVSAEIADKPDFQLTGHVNWDEYADIQTEIDINTDNGNYDFSAEFDNSEKAVYMRSGKSDARFKLESGVINSSVLLDDFSLHLDNNVNLKTNAVINGSFNYSNKDFNVVCDAFKLFVSDILSFGFSFDINQNTLNFNKLSIFSNNTEIDYDGTAHFEYDTIGDLFKGNYESLFYDVNLKKRNSQDYIRALSNLNDYHVSVLNTGNYYYSLNLLGSAGNGFFADCAFNSITFEASYKDKCLECYDGNGNISLFNIDDFNFKIDFINRTLNSRTIFKTTRHHMDKDVEQGGVVEINAKLETLVLGALSLAGIDVDARFNVLLRDCYLGNEFSFKNSDIIVTLSKNNLLFKSDLINGTYNLSSKYIDIDVNPDFLIGFKAKGYLESDIDLILSDIYIPARLFDQFINSPIISSEDGIIEGSVLVNGPSSDPSLFGSLYVQSFDMKLFYLPNQLLSIRNMLLNLHDHSITAEHISVIGSSSEDSRFYRAKMDLNLELDSLSVDSLNLKLDVYENAIKLWLPLKGLPLNILGDACGIVDVWYRNGELGIDADVTASNANVSFVLDECPEWFEFLRMACTANINLTIGNNVEFYYPSRQNPFMNFTVKEGEKFTFSHSSVTGKNTGEGNLDIKTGRISYIQNDFSVTEGQIKLTRPVLGQDGLSLSIDLNARLREYDAQGQRIDVYLVLKDAEFSNISPRFESIPYHTEKEILAILGQSILPGENQNVSFSGIANAAAVATDAMTSLGIVNTNQNYSINSVIKDSLDLDILSFRSPLVQNIIINAIPGYETSSNLLAKYLNGTTLYAGKYLNDSIFAKMTLLLKDSGHKGRNLHYGHFLTDDLNLDIEFSFDWDNPLGNFSLFMQPQELSVLNFLDNIGFSYTKRFKF